MSNNLLFLSFYHNIEQTQHLSKVKIESLPSFLETLLEVLRKQKQVTVFKAPCNYCNHDQSKEGFNISIINPVNYFLPLIEMKRSQRWSRSKDSILHSFLQAYICRLHCLQWQQTASFTISLRIVSIDLTLTGSFTASENKGGFSGKQDSMSCTSNRMK